MLYRQAPVNAYINASNLINELRNPYRVALEYKHKMYELIKSIPLTRDTSLFAEAFVYMTDSW